MIRATVISAIDQALLSALNFGLAILLIHFASKQEYGLYSQLINLQSFFSPLHAGIFVSAYLSLASKMDNARQITFRTAMARAEIVTTVLSTVVVIAICLIATKIFKMGVATTTCVAFGIALLGLWWREFVRQIRFASFRYDQALNIDAIYCLATVAAIACVLLITGLTTNAVFWCMAFGAVSATAVPLVAAIRGVNVTTSDIRQDVLLSWKMGRWEVLGSIVTWAYAQSYVYFAAIHGGLDAAAEISAGRLLAMPLALMWASYANVLRPSASRLLANGSSAASYRLATRSAIFVASSSVLYALIIFTLIPLLEQPLFAGKFQQLRSVAMWWIVYFTLTGISTVATSVLRSALEFRHVFYRQLISCVAAMALLTMGLKFQAIESLIIAMVIVEAISAGLFWLRLKTTLIPHPIL